MCFSASASFGASVTLVAIGVLSTKAAVTLPQKGLATIPFLFAIQQFVEGGIWIALQNPHTDMAVFWTPILMNLFLIFAWVIWPLYIPLIVSFLEEVPWKRKILKVMTVSGTVISGLLIYILVISDIKPVIKGYHIIYERSNELSGMLILGAFYIVHLLAPFFISTTRRLWYLGIINFGSLVIAQVLFTAAFISVWCFFAALSSAVIYWLILGMQKETTSKGMKYSSEVD
jgi:hypothetical protein